MQDILLTGGAGFIGSHLADALLRVGHNVIILDDLSVGKAANFEHHQGNPHFRFVKGSILDAHLVAELVEQVDAVYHLAAIVGVPYVVSNPLRGMSVNVRGMEIILEAASRSGAKVLVASSSEVYGRSTQVPFAEDDVSVLGSTAVPRWSYAVAKLLDEHLAFAYYRQTGLPVVAVRYFNAYGPRLDPRGYGSVVARFIMQALSGEPITIYGDGNQTRAFTFVKDTVRGTMAAMNADRGVGLAFNIGAPVETTIAELASMVRTLVDVDVDIVHVPYQRAYGDHFEEARRRLPDVSRAAEVLNYEATVSLEAGLYQTIEWFKEHHHELISA